MFINDVTKKEEIKNIAVKHLREIGVKYRPKKLRNVQEERIGRQCFKTALCLLPMQTVTLASGQQLVVPKLVDDLCSYILTKVTTEGLFRKGGSKARQNEMKLLLDSGSYLGQTHHEIDVANVLKTFFRELPEPLFPYAFHELFLHCVLSSQQLQALMLSCLLLPTEHLNTLAYFMQFLREVSQHSSLNKMDSHNLAIVMGPTLFPIEEKSAFNSAQRLTKFCDICKLLIENASDIGFISDRIIDQIAPTSLSADLVSCDEVNKKKKKRRSGSLTRMFNGLRKIVSSKSIDTSSKSPDLLQTPNIKVSDRKRRLDIQAFSNKKKHTLIQSLPQHTALSTPISIHPNPKKNPSPKSTNTNNR
ncbi:rho GTPase-activating protein 11B-like isoform X1 [Photinus pyralis]|nr:rho GTPase-activating protein 11B-like isoform X1 [Photinus pyralis]